MVANMISFLSLGIQALVPLQFPVTYPLFSVFASFLTVIFFLVLLSTAKCPSCKKRFMGYTGDEDDPPHASLFPSRCKYCEFPDAP